MTQSSDPATTPHVISLDRVSKRFGGAYALIDVDLNLRQGEVHCLVGENGAGKSTLGKVIAGVHRPDSGAMTVRGRHVEFRSPRDSLAEGVTFIAQELALAPERTVLDNVFMGQAGRALGLVRRHARMEEYERLVARYGFDVDPRVRAGSLRLAEQQKVEILRALASEANVIIMDEPTASLAEDETQKLLHVIRELRTEGRTVVFVTHFLGDALAVADRVTILKDGKLVRTSSAEDESVDSLIEAMLGRSLGSMFPARDLVPMTETALRVESLSRAGEFQDIDLTLRKGEIVGIAGLVGSGRTEFVETLAGIRRASSGSVEVGAGRGPFRSAGQAQRAGLVMVPESRKEHGLVMGQSVRANVTLPHLGKVSTLGFTSSHRQTVVLEPLLDSVGLDRRRIDSLVRELSGGNQQKVMFARWMFDRPVVFIADEPTRGVDVGARASLYQLMRSLASAGTGVLFVSSDNEEVVGLADRVVVMSDGRISGELDGDDITEANILPLMFAGQRVAG